jgi:hypothetical protein
VGMNHPTAHLPAFQLTESELICELSYTEMKLREDWTGARMVLHPDTAFVSIRTISRLQNRKRELRAELENRTNAACV